MNAPHYVSAQRLEELKDELRTLKFETIPKIAQQIDDAKQNGDLSENAEYSDAKERMAFAHGRVAQLERLISDAAIIEEPKANAQTVHIGMTIIVSVGAERRTYTIVGSSEADPSSGRISNESPIGEAFLGHAVGDEVVVTTPIKSTTYKILEIK